MPSPERRFGDTHSRGALDVVTSGGVGGGVRASNRSAFPMVEDLARSIRVEEEEVSA